MLATLEPDPGDDGGNGNGEAFWGKSHMSTGRLRYSKDMGDVCTGIHVVEGLPLWTSSSAPGDTGRSMLSQRGVVWTIL